MDPTRLFMYVLMAGLGLACVFLMAMACWLLFLTVRGMLLDEHK